MVSQLRSRVESILLVVDTPVEAEAVAGVLGATREDVDAVLREWTAELDARGSGIDLRETQEGWRLYTRPQNAEAVEAFVLDGTPVSYTHLTLPTKA